MAKVVFNKLAIPVKRHPLCDCIKFLHFAAHSGVIGKAPEAVTETLPVVEPEPEVEGATGGEVDDMQARLEALRS